MSVTDSNLKLNFRFQIAYLIAEAALPATNARGARLPPSPGYGKETI